MCNIASFHVAILCNENAPMVVQKVIQTFGKMYNSAIVHVLLGETFFFSHVIAISCSCHGMRTLLIAAS